MLLFFPFLHDGIHILMANKFGEGIPKVSVFSGRPTSFNAMNGGKVGRFQWLDGRFPCGPNSLIDIVTTNTRKSKTVTPIALLTGAAIIT